MRAIALIVALACGLVAGALLVVAACVPQPLPCYDFLDASANVVVLFNKCTGKIEVRAVEHTLPAPAPQSNAAPKLAF